MEAIVKLAIVAAFVLLIAVLGTASILPMVEDTMSELVTDKAELARAEGERYAMEMEALGEYELESAAAKAVRADTRIASNVVTVFVMLLILNSVGTVMLTFSLLKREIVR